MLAIRMQRTGRKGHAMFRMVVQDSHRTPTSGKVVALLGSYDPHAKSVTLDKEKASFYLVHGARPSDRVARLLKAEGVKLPKWAQLEGKKSGAIRNLDKLRKNRPEEEKIVSETSEPEVVAEATSETPAEQITEEAVTSDKTTETAAEQPAENET
jgi:small subunit ribosomal protein S16